MIMNNINKLLYTTLVVACLFPLRIYASKLHIDSIGFIVKELESHVEEEIIHG